MTINYIKSNNLLCALLVVISVICIVIIYIINSQAAWNMTAPNLQKKFSIVGLFKNNISSTDSRFRYNCTKQIMDNTSLKLNSKGTIRPALRTTNFLTEELYIGGHLNEEIDVHRICKVETKILILITSALAHAEARMSIRKTWGHYGNRHDVGIAFVLGSGANQGINDDLREENNLYGDMIRGHYVDSYDNLTLKVISALEWADQHCQNVKYILKTDDDMFINVQRLLRFVKKLDERNVTRAIFGRLAIKWKPVRNRRSKYYISENQFPMDIYPLFTTGPAYLITGDIVHELYMQSLKTFYIKLEDVLITGIVAEFLGIDRLLAFEFFNRRLKLTLANISKCISIHMINPAEQFQIWEKLHQNKSI